MPRQHANSEDLFTVMNDEERVDHWAALQKNKIKFPLFAWCFYTKWGQFSVDFKLHGSMAMCLAFSTCQQKIFEGKNFCELIFDCENCENFYLVKFPLHTALDVLLL